MKKAVLFFAVLLAGTPCVARIITVDDDGPADFSNIQVNSKCAFCFPISRLQSLQFLKGCSTGGEGFLIGFAFFPYGGRFILHPCMDSVLHRDIQT